jgi:serine O-acetyltransferase
LPDRDAVVTMVQRLRELMFPGFFGERDLNEQSIEGHVQRLVEGIGRDLFEQVTGALRYQKHLAPGMPRFADACAECDARARQVVAAFVKTLPSVRRLLSLDVQAAFDGDPAAQQADEVIFCYPGLHALMVHRLAHELYKLEVPLIPRIMAEHAHSLTGIDIHPGAKVGQSFFIDHGTGVVIGESTVIGDHCRIYQGVTLGAKSFQKDERGRLKRGVKRHPTLEDHVTIYAGATVLGGDTVIGAGSVINGGVFLTSSVPPGHVVRGPKADITLRGNPDMPPGNWAI